MSTKRTPPQRKTPAASQEAPHTRGRSRSSKRRTPATGFEDEGPSLPGPPAFKSPESKKKLVDAIRYVLDEGNTGVESSILNMLRPGIDAMINAATAELQKIIDDKDREIKALKDTIDQINSNQDANIINVPTPTDPEELAYRPHPLDNLKKIEELEQYGRRNSIKIRGIPVASLTGSTDDFVIELAKSKLQVEIEKWQIVRSHILGAPRDGKVNIIVRFYNYYVREKVFQNKKKLKGSGIIICEDLTQKRQSIINALAKLRNSEDAIQSFWSLNGTIKVRKSEASPPTKIDIWKIRYGKVKSFDDVKQFVMDIA